LSPERAVLIHQFDDAELSNPPYNRANEHRGCHRVHASVTRNLPSDRLLSAPMRPLVLVPVGAHSLPPATDLSDPYLTFFSSCTGASAVPLPADGFSINSSPN